MSVDLPHYPAAERNKAAIAEVLGRWCMGGIRVLELASGTGQHVVHFAEQLPETVVWQPTELDAALLPVIDLRVKQAELRNVTPALLLDVQADAWPDQHVHTLLAVNLLHVAPREVCEALFLGAERGNCAQVILYGPFNLDGQFTSEGNRRFHDTLTAQNPGWGLRDVAEVSGSANACGFVLNERVQMPANNQMLRYQSAD